MRLGQLSKVMLLVVVRRVLENRLPSEHPLLDLLKGGALAHVEQNVRGLGLGDLVEGSLFCAALGHGARTLLLDRLLLLGLRRCSFARLIGAKAVQGELHRCDVGALGQDEEFALLNEAAAEQKLLGAERREQRLDLIVGRAQLAVLGLRRRADDVGQDLAQHLVGGREVHLQVTKQLEGDRLL